MLGWALSSEVQVELAAPEAGSGRRLFHEELTGAAGPQTCRVSQMVLLDTAARGPQPHPAVLRKAPQSATGRQAEVYLLPAQPPQEGPAASPGPSVLAATGGQKPDAGESHIGASFLTLVRV